MRGGRFLGGMIFWSGGSRWIAVKVSIFFRVIFFICMFIIWMIGFGVIVG